MPKGKMTKKNQRREKGLKHLLVTEEN